MRSHRFGILLVVGMLLSACQGRVPASKTALPAGDATLPSAAGTIDPSQLGRIPTGNETPQFTPLPRGDGTSNPPEGRPTPGPTALPPSCLDRIQPQAVSTPPVGTALLSAGPQIIPAGGNLELCFQLPQVDPKLRGADSFTIHIPPGLQVNQLPGAGWQCETQPRERDDSLPGEHVDLLCADALFGAAPGNLVRMQFTAPASPGVLHLCLDWHQKDQIQTLCLDVQVSAPQ